MVHIQSPSTSNTLNKDISNLTHLTLASQTKPTCSPSTPSPCWSWGQPSLLTVPCLEVSDFRSNGQVTVDSEDQPASFTPPISGLGIRYEPTPEDACGDSTQGSQCRDNLIEAQALPDPVQGPQSSLSPPLMDELSHLFGPPLPISWSFDSNTSGSAFTMNSNTSNLADNSSANDLAPQSPRLYNPFQWSFDDISAASGYSVDVLATQISAAADVALQQMAPTTNLAFPNDIFLNEFSTNQDSYFDWPTLPYDPGNDSPTHKSKAYKNGIKWKEPSFGVRPAETTGSLELAHKLDQYDLFFDLPPVSSFPSASSNTSYLSSLRSSDSFFADAENTDEDDVPGFLTDILVDPGNIKTHLGSEAHYHVLRSSNLEEDSNSDYEPPSNKAASSRESSPFPSPRPRKGKHMLRRVKRRSTKILPVMESLVKVEEALPRKPADRIDINLGTPIFDAHKGISMTDLQEKAKRYRERNPGQDYDKRWLISFAGKLSQKGELLEDFRCYVLGCTQNNKRRDHILIHIGAHLDQRPFGCPYCPSRFLRKNECKRHEMSHSGARPHACTICPPDAAPTFVRQDLLKRHLKRRHPTDTEVKTSTRESLESEEHLLKRMKIVY